jgi:hypothetical protein
MTAAVHLPGPGLPGSPEAPGRAGPGGALASEWTKIRTVRSTWWTLAILVVVSAGLGVLVTAAEAPAAGAAPRPGFDAAQLSLGAFLYAGPLVLAVTGASGLPSEYATGMIRASLAAQPRRVTFFLAKTAVTAGVALAFSLTAASASFAAGQAVLGPDAVPLTAPHVLRAVAGGALYVTMTCLIAFGIGAVLRHSAGAITASFGVLFIVPVVAEVLPGSWNAEIARWLPGSAAQVLTATTGPQGGPQYFGPWEQFAVTAAWAGVLLAAGTVLVCRRDT